MKHCTLPTDDLPSCLSYELFEDLSDLSFQGGTAMSNDEHSLRNDVCTPTPLDQRVSFDGAELTPIPLGALALNPPSQSLRSSEQPHQVKSSSPPHYEQKSAFGMVSGLETISTRSAFHPPGPIAQTMDHPVWPWEGYGSSGDHRQRSVVSSDSSKLADVGPHHHNYYNYHQQPQSFLQGTQPVPGCWNETTFNPLSNHSTQVLSRPFPPHSQVLPYINQVCPQGFNPPEKDRGYHHYDTPVTLQENHPWSSTAHHWLRPETIMSSSDTMPSTHQTKFTAAYTELIRSVDNPAKLSKKRQTSAPSKKRQKTTKSTLARLQKKTRVPQDDDPNLPSGKPLSTYNFFFRWERVRILEDVDNREGPRYWLWDEDFQRKVLEQHWAREQTEKRKVRTKRIVKLLQSYHSYLIVVRTHVIVLLWIQHRASHGKIAFNELTKRVSATWRTLPDSAKAVFREIAAKDLLRYSHEMQLVSQNEGGDTKAELSTLVEPSDHKAPDEAKEESF